MAPPQKRAFDRQDGSSQQAKKPRTAAAPTPAFTSSLQHEEVDFPRGGGTSLTALEMKETMLEGRREADMEAEQEAETAKSQKPKKVGKREVARKKKENDLEKQKEWDKDKIREW
jgi:rRNA biogenesis protein RRP5